MTDSMIADCNLQWERGVCSALEIDLGYLKLLQNEFETNFYPTESDILLFACE